jgi:nucleotide-binding universal stress UspA family protein
MAADDLRLGHCRQDEEQPRVSDRDLVSATADADVVVIACRRNNGAGQRHAHSMHALLHHSHCPVLLIPTGPNGPLHL